MSEPDGPRGPDSPPWSNPSGADPFAPVDYPHDYPEPARYPPMPPPVYPAPPGFGAPPSYLPPQPFYDPYNPYGSGAPSGTNGKAIASLVCGAAGLALCMCFVPSMVAVALGVAALSEISRTGQPGKGLAITGTVLGAATLLLGVVVMLIGAFGN